MATLATFREFARVEAGEDDAVLQLCLNAAQENLEAQGVPETASGSLYDVTVYRLALHLYEQRQAQGEEGADTLYGVQQGVNLMHYGEG